jgi:hypothetical protein
VPESAVLPPDTNDVKDELDGKNLLASLLVYRLLVAGVRADELRTTPDMKKEVTLLERGRGDSSDFDPDVEFRFRYRRCRS